MNKSRFIPCLVMLAALCASPANYAQEIPGDYWDYSDDPAAQGWDEERLSAFREFLVDDTHVTGLMIVHQGRVVFEYGDVVETSYIASIRKSVLAMLYGKYVENGMIDLDETIGDLGIDDVEGILPREKQATVQDIISARSGVYHPEGYPGGMQEYAPARGSKEPGSWWLYSNWDFNVAGWIFEHKTGRNIYDEVQEQLAIPLHMQDWNRLEQRKSGDVTRSKFLAYPMWFSTRDMARIGQLMLNRGWWGRQQVISEKWVDEMLKQRTKYEEIHASVPVFKERGSDYGYGYMWWLWENREDPRVAGAYSGKGAMGQNITVFPAIDTVLAFKTKAAYRRSNSGEIREAIVKRVPKLYQPGED
jgi:CubicO group peptidase (beta-lactamase class C family)